MPIAGAPILSVLQATCFQFFALHKVSFTKVAACLPQVSQIKGFPQALDAPNPHRVPSSIQIPRISSIEMPPKSGDLPVGLSRFSAHQALLFANLQDGEESLLRNVDFADALHPLLAFLLFRSEEHTSELQSLRHL